MLHYFLVLPLLSSERTAKYPAVLLLQQVNEDMQMSRLSKNFNFFVLSFQWLLRLSDILVLITTNFLSSTTSIKKSTVPAFFLAYVYKFIIYVVTFLLGFKPTNFSSFSIHKISETKRVLIKFRPAIGASPLWTEAMKLPSFIIII